VLLSREGKVGQTRTTGFPGFLTSKLNSSKPRACSARFKPAPWPTAARACSELLSASCRASPTIQPTVASLSPVLLVGDALSNQAGKLLADRLLDSPRYSRVMELRKLCGGTREVQMQAQSRFLLRIQWFSGSVFTLLQDASKKSSSRRAVSRISTLCVLQYSSTPGARVSSQLQAIARCDADAWSRGLLRHCTCPKSNFFTLLGRRLPCQHTSWGMPPVSAYVALCTCMHLLVLIRASSDSYGLASPLQSS